ncbi:MAG: cytochrome c-type biogenesis protein CcmH [Solirubrobacterales bacterium]|nr:cytochrome c-type biogenesis protein CcmH [Solirubrobacterales bacterium]
MKRLISIVLVLTFVFGGVASAAEPQASLPQLEDEVMCPICGTLLGLSRAPAAERERVFIRGLIKQGKNEDEIKDALVAEYGPQVLALPDDEGINFFAYLVPVLAFILAALAVLYSVIRWRRNKRSEAPADRPPPTPKSDNELLDRDMEKYDL